MAGTIEIVGIAGSVRPGNFTSKALALVADELSGRDGVHYRGFDPAKLGLSLPGLGEPSPELLEMHEAVKRASGVVLATPEYHGSYSSVMKLVIDNLGFPSTLRDKPVALLGVAAGRIGAIKALEHLRSVCSHVGSIVLPGPISIAGVQAVFDDEGRCTDEAVEKQIRSVADRLLGYLERHVCPGVVLEEMARS